jgi:hypothetical protein
MASALLLALGLAVSPPDRLSAPPTVDGVIVRVDHDGERINVCTPAGHEYWFVCDPRTAVTVGGERADFDALWKGFRTRVAFDPWSGVALRVDARP